MPAASLAHSSFSYMFQNSPFIPFVELGEQKPRGAGGLLLIKRKSLFPTLKSLNSFFPNFYHNGS